MKDNSIYKTKTGENQIMAFYDSVLNTWPVNYKTKKLPTRYGDTFVIESGSENAPALILLHGASSNATSWSSEVQEYSLHFRVYAIDIPGEPGKSSQNKLSLNNLEFAVWLNDVYKELKIKKSSIIGISQGAWTALRFATCYPEKVDKLVVLTPAGIVPTKTSFILKAIFYSMFGKAGTKKINRIVVGKQKMNPQVLSFMDLIQANFKARIEKEYIFSDSELNKLDIPVLLVGGEDDVIRSVSDIAKRMQEVVKDLTVLSIPEMGHVLIGLNQRIIPFLIE